MHIPKTETQHVCIQSFKNALTAYENSIPNGYSKDRWLYVPHEYSEYRYILGTRGKNPLICVGINPSTAEPDNLDNTLKSVERIALANGFDSFIMFNVYAQRATVPDDMDREANLYLHRENMNAFRYVLENSEKASVWAAWGAIIEKRKYLSVLVSDMIDIGEEYGAKWYTSGKISVKGHPHHPLYLKKDSALDEFDIKNYFDTVLNG